MLKQEQNDTINNIDIPNQTLLNAIAEVPWGIAITERKESTNNIIFINQTFENMIACEAKVVVGQDWQILLGKIEDLHLPAKIHKAARDGKHCSVVITKPSQFGNDSYSYHELSVTPMCNEHADVTHLIWLMKDVTDEIVKEAQLVSTIEKREERFSAYLDIANEAIWRIDFIPPIQLCEPLLQQVQKIFENGIFAEANNAVARTYGLNVGTEVIGKPLNEFMEKTNPENIEQMIEYVNNNYNMKNVITYEKKTNGITRTIINNTTPGIENNAVKYVWGASLDVTDLFETQKELESSQQQLSRLAETLEKKNIALNELIAHIELDKKKLKDKLRANIEQVLLPSLDRIKLNKNINNDIYIMQHRNAIEQLTSSFGIKVSDSRLKLTPREVEICSMVKNGFSSKEIADSLNIALHTIEKHRRTVRKKLGLANQKINLRTYLNSL